MVNKKKPSILFVTRCYPPTTGGMERFAYDIHAALSKKTKIHLLSWGGSKKYLPLILPYFFLRSFLILLFKKVDVIHAQDGVVSITLLPLKYIFRKPFVVVVHGLDVTYKNKIYQYLIRKSLASADKVIAISNGTRNQAIKHGSKPNKTVFIALGMYDTIHTSKKKNAKEYVQKQAGIQPSQKIILYSGRLVRRKGAQWFIENIFPKVLKNKPNSVFILSGGGPEEENIKKSATEQGVLANVRVLGRTSDRMHHSLYNAADVFVMPNIRVPGDMEGFGLVLLEAGLCELPIVAIGIEGIKDAVKDGKNGVLIKEDDASGFAEQLIYFLENKKERKAFGKKTRKYVLNHNSWDKIADSYVEVYKQVSELN